MSHDINTVIDEILENYQTDIGADINKYRNHVYRVYQLCLLLDNKIENQEKYAITAAFHDIGIWSDQTFDYLAPSIARMQEYLKMEGKSEWTDEISYMINMHHKISSYSGKYKNTVETFRKADWVDVSMGVLNFNIKKSQIRLLTKEFPTLGFHHFLVVQTTKNFFKHPFNPLPMFKK